MCVQCRNVVCLMTPINNIDTRRNHPTQLKLIKRENFVKEFLFIKMSHDNE